MAFSNIDALNLGKLLQIAFSNGVRNQISENYREFEEVMREREGDQAARERRFSFQTSYGPASIQYRNPGTSGFSFPTAQQITVSEHTAKFKELYGTIEIEENLWSRALSNPLKYAEPLELEIDSKTIAAKRRIAADFYMDGTGVLATVSSVSDSDATDEYTVTLKDDDADRGHVGWCEFGDLLLGKQNDGTARAPTETSGSSFYAWRVKDRDFDNRTVTLEPVDSSGAIVTDITASNLASGDYLARVGQPTFADLSSISDYGVATEVIAGLESLTANDGRTIHDIVMSGANAGSRKSANNDPIDVKHIQAALDKAKRTAGPESYRWKKMCMSYATHSALIDSRETDRRFHLVTDNKRGTSHFAYVHGQDSLEAYSSEYCPEKRIYMLPEAKNGKKVLEFWGTDFTSVRAKEGDEFMLKPASGGGHENKVVSYLRGRGVIICNHPAAIAVVTGFRNT